MIKFSEQNISGVYLIENFFAEDNRGVFTKTIHENLLEEIGFTDKFRESYYSLSYKNVIRGMHFQKPPQEHDKLVFVSQGSILDVVLDLRESSSTYGKCFSTVLSEFGQSLLIPRGCAHGFKALSYTATVLYNVTTVYDKTADSGILWNSFGFDWGISNPVISERDLSFEPFSEFKSPFL